MDANQQIWLIPALPLAGALINGLFGPRLGRMAVNLIAIGSVLISFLWVFKTLSALDLSTAYTEQHFTWISSGDFRVGFDFMIDRLTAVMLLVITGIGALIHIYSIGYMSHEEGYARFFAYLNLFMFFMLVLVLANNFLLAFVGWEGVGLCSYLLIGFYHREKWAGDAARKAFVVNRIGDLGFSLGMFLIAITFGTLDYAGVFAKVAPLPVEASAGLLTTIALLLFVGAAGKSAQMPLYVWLPDAMAGPTPVSALIHAATMVTAGVYLCARASVIFSHSPIALNVILAIGTVTALFAALIGLAQNDIKKVFAYSTVSQLGYMFMAVGAEAYSAGIFHVVTHAFFKALLFLGAGSVIHALSGEQDLRKMGGLRAKIPTTFGTLAVAWIAISGVPPLSGFHSKDEILAAVWHTNHLAFAIGLFTAFLTAFYVSRAMFLAFWGDYRGKAHPHESPAVMTLPLVILAMLSFGGGYFPVLDWLAPLFPRAHEGHESWLLIVSSLVGIGGILAAWYVYVAAPGTADRIAASFGRLYTAAANKFYVDEVFDNLIVHPMEHGSKSVLWRGFDAKAVDGIVDGSGSLAMGASNLLRRMQSGMLRSYAAWVTAGCVLLLLVLTLGGRY
jgi:NADH-quinone oxidoreductase subunit L